MSAAQAEDERAEPPSLRLVLATPQQIKHFRNAVHALFKIGSDLLLEATHEQLIIHTVSSAQSAFLSLDFTPNFFASYQLGSAELVQTAILLKHILSSLRTQKIAQYELEVSHDTAHITAVIYAENGIKKTYRLDCMNAQFLNAVVDKEAFPTHIIADAKEVSRLLSTFQSNLDEVTLIANPDTVESAASGCRACQLQSHVEGSKKEEASLHTAVAVDIRSFVRYSHRSNEPSDVTFNLKDFRIMVTLCEQMQRHLSIKLDQAGAPLLVEAHFEAAEAPALRASLVLGTIPDSLLGAAVQLPAYQSQQPAAQQVPSNSQHISARNSTPHQLPVHGQHRPQHSQLQVQGSERPMYDHQPQHQQHEQPQQHQQQYQQQVPATNQATYQQQQPPLYQQHQQQQHHHQQQQQSPYQQPPVYQQHQQHQHQQQSMHVGPQHAASHDLHHGHVPSPYMQQGMTERQAHAAQQEQARSGLATKPAAGPNQPTWRATHAGGAAMPDDRQRGQDQGLHPGGQQHIRQQPGQPGPQSHDDPEQLPCAAATWQQEPMGPSGERLAHGPPAYTFLAPSHAPSGTLHTGSMLAGVADMLQDAPAVAAAPGYQQLAHSTARMSGARAPGGTPAVGSGHHLAAAGSTMPPAPQTASLGHPEQVMDGTAPASAWPAASAGTSHYGGHVYGSHAVDRHAQQQRDVPRHALLSAVASTAAGWQQHAHVPVNLNQPHPEAVPGGPHGSHVEAIATPAAGCGGLGEVEAVPATQVGMEEMYIPEDVVLPGTPDEELDDDEVHDRGGQGRQEPDTQSDF